MRRGGGRKGKVGYVWVGEYLVRFVLFREVGVSLYKLRSGRTRRRNENEAQRTLPHFKLNRFSTRFV